MVVREVLQVMGNENRAVISAACDKYGLIEVHDAVQNRVALRQLTFESGGQS